MRLWTARAMSLVFLSAITSSYCKTRPSDPSPWNIMYITSVNGAAGLHPGSAASARITCVDPATGSAQIPSLTAHPPLSLLNTWALKGSPVWSNTTRAGKLICRRRIGHAARPAEKKTWHLRRRGEGGGGEAGKRRVVGRGQIFLATWIQS